MSRLLAVCTSVTLLLIAAFHTPALAERRVALVIGNAQYLHTSPLKNPRNDAAAIAAALRELDFDVIEGLDLRQIEMQKAVAEFAAKLETADVGLLYYAGHGMQVDGKNFLVPVDARLTNLLELQFQTIATDVVLGVMESRQRVSILLLDACRDNPLAEQLSRSLGTRSTSLGRGLAKIETGVGTYIGFSTQPGNVALDGDGQYSPFAEALIDSIKKPGIDIELMMRQVRADVMHKTRGNQVPWGNSSLVGSFVFGKPEVVVAETQPEKLPEPERDTNSSNATLEIVFWNTIKDSNDPALLEAYIERFPNGAFVPIASVLLRRLQTEARIDDAARQKAEDVARLEAERQAAEDAKRQAEEADRLEAERRAAEEARKLAEEIARLEAERQAAEAAAKAAQQQLAMLGSPGGKAETTEVVTAEPTRDLITGIQNELNRLGCEAGKADGVWGTGSRRALEQYARHAGVQLASLDPSTAVLEGLRGMSARVCPLVCGKGMEVKGERCVARACPRGQALDADGNCASVTRKAPAPKRQAEKPAKAEKTKRKRECGVMSDGCNFFSQ